MINFDDFSKVELKVGIIKSAERIEGSDKLLSLKVNLAEEELRSLVAGIGKSYEPDDLVDKQIVVVSNLEPKEIFGHTSYGMLLAVGGVDDLSLISPEKQVPAGSRLS